MSLSSARPARLILALALAGCALAAAAFAAAPAARATVWLCKPGVKPDPCNPGLSTTLYNPALTTPLGVRHPKAEKAPPIDCFYVYPTVSDEKTANSDLKIQSTERSIALYQAARYSQLCRVYAPMYRQVTLAGAGLSGSSSQKPNPALAVKDVEAAFADYLKHDNHGRGFVFIGHSQGSGVLRTVIANKVDPRPAVRRRMLSAILMGGNVLVKKGKNVGGDFQHIPACRSATELGCVIAFSTFDQPVPPDSLFGRPGTLDNNAKGDEVLCTNPASLSGGSGILDTIQPSAPFAPGTTLGTAQPLLWKAPAPKTVYWETDGAYTARCVNDSGAHVLMIAPRHGAQTPAPVPTPQWGLHLLDANIALGNLLADVRAETRRYVSG